MEQCSAPALSLLSFSVVHFLFPLHAFSVLGCHRSTGKIKNSKDKSMLGYTEASSNVCLTEVLERKSFWVLNAYSSRQELLLSYLDAGFAVVFSYSFHLWFVSMHASLNVITLCLFSLCIPPSPKNIYIFFVKAKKHFNVSFWNLLIYQDIKSWKGK